MMTSKRPLPLALGAVAITSGTALVTLDTIFAVTLSNAHSPSETRITAIIAAGLGALDVALLGLLLGRQMRCCNGAYLQDYEIRRKHTFLLASSTGGLALLEAVAALLLLSMMRVKTSEIPKTINGSKTEDVVVGGFVVWAIALATQAVFTICVVIIQRRDFHKHIQPYQPDSTPEPESEMQERVPKPASVRDSGFGGNVSMESPPPSSHRSRPGSDTRASIRSSLSQVVRPITSKTKLISPRSPITYSAYRPTSVESSIRDTVVSMDDGFDSWDTSTVDADSRHALNSASPTPPRFLETIPASPTGSRSPSPGFPLDLEPPKPTSRSRSYSPAASIRSRPRSRTTSPTESMVVAEAHIHPLFRSDSPTPAPATTPGTVVTAAPGAGQVISSAASVRSVKRMRSGSLPTSPLMHQDSLDSIRRTIEREEDLVEEYEESVERKLTPPIPEWILQGAAPRTSMSGSRKEKRRPNGLGKVGEMGEG